MESLPLTAITAWELLFDRLGVPEGGGAGQTLLVVGAAGGVGSMLVQLARQLTQLRVVGTASRPETQAWVRQLGAHAVVDHTQPLRAQLTGLILGEAAREQPFAEDLADIAKVEAEFGAMTKSELRGIFANELLSRESVWRKS